MANWAQSEKRVDTFDFEFADQDNNCLDLELTRTIVEQLEGAQSVCDAPSALLCVKLFERDIHIPLNLEPWIGERIRVSAVPDTAYSWNICGDDLGAASVLSVPICVDQRIRGAIHMVDRSLRDYSEGEVASVVDIAGAIGQRLDRFLGPEREERRESLMRRAISPAFAELRNALVPLNLGTADLRVVSADLAPIVNRLRDSEGAEDQAATLAYEDLVSLVDEIARAATRVRDVAMVVERLWGEGGRCVVLHDLLQTAAALALHSTRLVGGVEMPEVLAEFSIQARRSVAVAGLSLLLSRMAEANANGVVEVTPLKVELDVEEQWFVLRVTGVNLQMEELHSIGLEVEMLLLGDEDLSVAVVETQVCMRLTRRS